jgi:hypothetical protein
VSGQLSTCSIAQSARTFSVAVRPSGFEARSSEPRICLDKGADGETRTPDPFITSEVLYQLSYVGMPEGRA